MKIDPQLLVTDQSEVCSEAVMSIRKGIDFKDSIPPITVYDMDQIMQGFPKLSGVLTPYQENYRILDGNHRAKAYLEMNRPMEIEIESLSRLEIQYLLKYPGCLRPLKQIEISSCPTFFQNKIKSGMFYRRI